MIKVKLVAISTAAVFRAAAPAPFDGGGAEAPAEEPAPAVELPDDPMRYTASPSVDPHDGTWAATGINEAGVGMTATETITSSTAFSIQENVKDLLDGYQNSLPDVIVCLSDINTRSVYQCIVESNRVGSTKILGYYDSDMVVKGIERGSIFATFTVATDQMAKFCVDALNEYKEMGNVSAYFSTDYEIVNFDTLTARQLSGGKGKDEEN